jgi:hypothetical protein
MFEFLANPGYLAVGGALISVPVIIHLINRLRFKRLRWAAMEFLLKAQKRTRKRLIIEQLLLLAMRCFLVALLGLLVVRLIDVSPTDLWDSMWRLLTREAGGQVAAVDTSSNLHVVLLDDTLSMSDQWKDGETAKDAFHVAKNEILQERIVKKLGQVRSANRVMLVPLSQVVLKPDMAPKVYDRLNDQKNVEELQRDVEALEPTRLHVDMLQAVKKVQQIVSANSSSRVYLHILSDFRQKDWGLPEADTLYKSLIEMGREHKHLRIRLIDTVHPYRTAALGGYPQSHDNVGIVELRPSTRIAGKNMPVNFTATLANYSGREVEVNLVVYNENNGTPIHEAAQSINPPMPLKLPPASTKTVNFDLRFNPALKAGETYFSHISARLLTAQLQPLPNDGLADDNVRHAAVEVREKVPILLVDGEGSKGREVNKDSFFIGINLASIPGASFEVVNADELGGGVAAKALERADLHKYPSIFMLNVRELNPKQQAHLEAFVKDGGGVAFFMGPAVSSRYYNKELYKDGKGLFPVPLKETYYPPPSEEPLAPKASDTPQLLLRDKLFPDPRAYPIFGVICEKPEQRDPLLDLPIRRYFQVPRGSWKPEPGRVLELATLPNDQPITVYQQAVLDITRGDKLRGIFAKEEFAKYRRSLERHFKEIETLVGPASEKKAYHLALAFDSVLNDQGKEKEREAYPNLTEFWSSPEPEVQGLRREIRSLYEQVQYGDPFVIAQTYGKGRVVAVMTTAGKEWTDFAGGSGASILFTPFIWEMQNYLSSQGSASNLTLGTPIDVSIDTEAFKQKNEPLKLETFYMRTQEGKPAEPVRLDAEEAREVDGQIKSRFTRTDKPGLYLSQLRTKYEQPGTKGLLASYGHVYNIDTQSEGPLQRVSQDQLDKELIRQLPEGTIRLESPDSISDDLVETRKDFSESLSIFLIFLCLLVAEQALAVHLSFHMRGSEGELLTKAMRPPSAAA